MSYDVIRNEREEGSRRNRELETLFTRLSVCVVCVFVCPTVSSAFCVWACGHTAGVDAASPPSALTLLSPLFSAFARHTSARRFAVLRLWLTLLEAVVAIALRDEYTAQLALVLVARVAYVCVALGVQPFVSRHQRMHVVSE
jgi:hypothetical protein